MAGALRLMLLGGFRLSSGDETVALPMAVQRVVAFVAVQDRPVRRDYVAVALWLDATEAQASASLRSTLWKLRRLPFDVLEVRGGFLRLASQLTVDLRVGIALAQVAVAPPSGWDPVDADVTLLSEDLLPSWHEQWVLVARERYRQLRLHALEALCEQLSDAGHHAAAVQAGLAAVSDDPLRESAQRVLIRAFLLEGNVSEARRQFDAFRTVLRDELGVAPSATVRAMVEGRPD